MAKQLYSLAYGRLAYGGVVFGGENAGLFTLGEDWGFRSLLGGLVVSGSVVVHGTSAVPIDERIAALAALRQERGHFALTTGVDVSATVDLTSSGQVLTITAASGTPFLSSHVGLPIEITGVGSYMLTGFTSTTVVTAQIPAALSPPGDDTGLSATIGRVVSRVREDTKEGGFNGGGEFSTGAGGENEPDRIIFAFALVFDAAASDSRPTAAGDRLIANVSQDLPSGGARRVGFEATYTAADSEEAKDRYDAQFAGWVAEEMEALLGASPQYEIVGRDQLSFDDRKNQVTIRAVRQEVPSRQTVAEFNSSKIDDLQIQIGIAQLARHGFQGGRPPAVASVSFNCTLKRGQVAAGGVLSFFYNQLYKNVVTILRTVSQSTVIVVDLRGPVYNNLTETLSGACQAILPSTGSSITAYVREVSYLLDYRKTHYDRFDQQEMSAVVGSPGRLIIGTTSVAMTELTAGGGGGAGEIPVFGIGGEAGDLFGFGGGGDGAPVFGIGGQAGDLFTDDGGLTITFEDEDNAGGDEDAPQYNPVGPPIGADAYFAKAPFKLNVPPGDWDPLRIFVSDLSEVIGDDPVGAGAQGIERVRRISQVFRWVTNKSALAREGAEADPNSNKTKTDGENDEGNQDGGLSPGEGDGGS